MMLNIRQMLDDAGFDDVPDEVGRKALVCKVNSLNVHHSLQSGEYNYLIEQTFGSIYFQPGESNLVTNCYLYASIGDNLFAEVRGLLLQELNVQP